MRIVPQFCLLTHKAQNIDSLPFIGKVCQPLMQARGIWVFTVQFFRLSCMFENILNTILEKEDAQHSNNAPLGDVRVSESMVTPSLPLNLALLS